jgi:Bacterial Ig domain/Dipeptidyl peptidase IV (DPP IV) N-terminal region/WD40-like Beta Propeller Repeat
MMCRLAPAGAVAVLVALAVFPAPASATFIPGPNGKIAFASGRANSEVPSPVEGDDTKAKIWVADYPSGTPVQVTTLPANSQARHPNWSPDHSKIVYAAGTAFSGEYALWIVDLRTGEQTEFVKTAPMQDRPSWSPDGTQIAFGSAGDLWVKNVDDTNPESKGTQITDTPGIVEERPVWSPDGETLYYNRGEAGKQRDVYSKSPITLTGAEIPIVTGATDDWQPALSPDGKRLCFLRGPQSDGADIYTVNINGTGVAPFSATSLVGDLNCVWSPDGTRIMYTRGAFAAGELFTRDINGNNPTAVTSMNVEKHFDGNADWATNFPPKCDARTAQIGVNQFATISLSCTDPDFGFGASPPTPTPLEPEALEIAMGPSHGTIGSISNGKVVYTPNKDFQGTDSFTYTGSDGTSNAVPASVTIQVGNPPAGDNIPPSISAIKLSAKKWRLGKGLAKTSKAPVGTTISFNLSEAARATLTFQSARPGRKSGQSCVRQKSANRRKPGCTRYVNAGSISFNANAGGNRVKFQGLITKSRRLSPGAYRVVVGARDGAGNRSSRNGPGFTIVQG